MTAASYVYKAFWNNMIAYTTNYFPLSAITSIRSGTSPLYIMLIKHRLYLNHISYSHYVSEWRIRRHPRVWGLQWCPWPPRSGRRSRRRRLLSRWTRTSPWYHSQPLGTSQAELDFLGVHASPLSCLSCFKLQWLIRLVTNSPIRFLFYIYQSKVYRMKICIPFMNYKLSSN